MARMLSWLVLLVGLVLWVVGRVSGPSPGSEWPVLEIVGPLFAGLGLVGVLLDGIARRWRRR